MALYNRPPPGDLPHGAGYEYLLTLFPTQKSKMLWNITSTASQPHQHYFPRKAMVSSKPGKKWRWSLWCLPEKSRNCFVWSLCLWNMTDNKTHSVVLPKVTFTMLPHRHWKSCTSTKPDRATFLITNPDLCIPYKWKTNVWKKFKMFLWRSTWSILKCSGWY